MAAEKIELLNMSYDPTRELWRDQNAAFVAKYEKEHPGIKLSIKQSHGGSSTQARAVIDGLEAEVTTLASLATRWEGWRLRHDLQAGEEITGTADETVRSS